MKKEKIKRIMKGTCFDSLSFCCDFYKSCVDRDNVIKKLGLKKKDFTKLKKNFDEELFKILK